MVVVEWSTVLFVLLLVATLCWTQHQFAQKGRHRCETIAQPAHFVPTQPTLLHQRQGQHEVSIVLPDSTPTSAFHSLLFDRSLESLPRRLQLPLLSLHTALLHSLLWLKMSDSGQKLVDSMGHPQEKTAMGNFIGKITGANKVEGYLDKAWNMATENENGGGAAAAAPAAGAITEAGGAAQSSSTTTSGSTQ